MRRVLRGAFASVTLNRALVGVAEARDRGFITDLVYGTLRHLPYLDAALADRLPAPERLPEEVLCALRIGAYERLVRGTPAHAAVDAWVEVAGAQYPKLKGLVNAVLRRLAPPRRLAPHTELRLPSWLASALHDSLGEHAEAAARGMLEPEPLWLASFHPDAAATLRDEGCETAPGPLEDTLRIRPSRPLGTLRAFQEGMVQPQNPSSVLAAGLIEASPDERVLDLASGHGIKSARLARAGARVVAVELDAGRIEAARSNLARLGLAAEHVQADLTDPTSPALPGLEPAAKVLLDAPCSGTGTLRGHPEIKLRLEPDDLAGLSEQQERMLDVAAALTAPGGVLVYAVCALTRVEGDEQIARFLARQRRFHAERLELPLDSVSARHGTYLLPLDGRDGFYLSRLRRSD